MNPDAKPKIKYSKKFNEEDKKQLRKKNVPTEIANRYPARFNGLAVGAMYSVGCMPDKCREYNKLLSPLDDLDPYALYKSGCSPKEAAEWGWKNIWDIYLAKDKTDKVPVIRFFEVASLHSAGCSIERALEYYDLFYEKGMREGGLGTTIAYYFAEGCPPKTASAYPEEVMNIGFLLYRLHILPDALPTEEFKKLAEVFTYAIFNEETLDNSENYTLLGTGNMSVVIFDKEKNTARKTSLDQSHELEILKRLENAKTHHLVKLKGTTDNPYTLELEYVNGNSLENILKKENKLDYARVFRYGSNIMDGLIELRRAGIFNHRDIRPANIMIDEVNDRAIIIDLGIATTNRHTLPLDNRRYGGPNDLVSLGQVMYKMATGEHLFAGSRTMEMTKYADDLKDERDAAYADKTGKSLEKYLTKVDENIQDERLKTIIKSCLTAENFHYKNIWKMFKQLGAYDDS